MKVSFYSLRLELREVILQEIEYAESAVFCHEGDSDYHDSFTVHRDANEYLTSTSGQCGENIPDSALDIVSVFYEIPPDDSDYKITVHTSKDFALWDQDLDK